MADERVKKSLLQVLRGERQKRSSGLDDAAGGTLSAGISRGARKGRRVSRSLFFAGARRRSDVAADPALRFRCRDSVFRYPGHSACARPQGVVRRGRRAETRSDRKSGHRSRSCRSRRIRTSSRRFTRRWRASNRNLPPDVTLLGFCGAPWTVATYMIAGEGTPDQAPARIFAYRHPEAFAALIDRLVERVDRLSGAAIAGRRRCGADFRYLGRRVAAGGIPPLVDGADAENRRRRAQANSGREDHRVSARRRQHACRFMRITPMSMPSASTG